MCAYLLVCLRLRTYTPLSHYNKALFSCVRPKELACRVAVRVLSTTDSHRLISAVSGCTAALALHAHVRRSRGRVCGRQHRPQDGQRAHAGASAARPGATVRPAAPASLGPPLQPARPRRVRRRCQARHHIPQGPRHPQQAHAGEVPEAER